MIEGLEHLEKDGWELVRIGTPKLGVDNFLADDGTIKLCNFNSARMNCVIIRKTEKPKQYRPCENMAEAIPFWDRKLKEKRGDVGAFRVVAMGDASAGIGFGVYTYREAFEKYECDDGTPFGVEVKQ